MREDATERKPGWLRGSSSQVLEPEDGDYLLGCGLLEGDRDSWVIHALRRQTTDLWEIQFEDHFHLSSPAMVTRQALTLPSCLPDKFVTRFISDYLKNLIACKLGYYKRFQCVELKSKNLAACRLKVMSELTRYREEVRRDPDPFPIAKRYR